jgi:hypothetical protein
MYALLLIMLLIVILLAERFGNWRKPDCSSLWELNRTKNETWSNIESEDVYVSAPTFGYSLVL